MKKSANFNTFENTSFDTKNDDFQQKNVHFSLISAYLGFGKLAQCYSPDHSPRQARRRLRSWIGSHPTLRKSLSTLGFSQGQRTLTPAQVGLIFEALGEP